MKTLKIFFKLCELNLKKLLVYRASFFISLLLMSIWLLAYLTLIEVIFYHTSTLAGWNKGQVLLLMSFYYLIQNISDIFFKDNFEDFGQTVRHGELDFKIVKPAPLRLLSFFWEIRFDHAASLIPTFAMMMYAFFQITISLPFFFAALALISVSVVLYFNILCIIATLTFWISRNETFNVLIFNISQLSRYPRQIYRHIVGKILTFGIPLALIASVPAEVALEADREHLTLLLLTMTLIFSILSRCFWKYGVKKYSSAN